MFKRIFSSMVIMCFFFTSLGPLPKAHADTVLGLPQPGSMVNLSSTYEPALIKGLTVHKDNPFLFDFIVDTGRSGLSGDALKTEGDRLVKYFFACLTIPEKDLWVNLSPYEKDRMIPQALGQTALGRDLLAQDYILKQLTASLIYPEKNLGKEFWNRVYAKAQAEYGTTQIPVNTFNKVWILADKASVYENNQTAFVLEGHLKVMLEEDYLALQKHSSIATVSAINQPNTINKAHSIASQIVKQIVLPEIEKEVNTGKNFAMLRQIFYSEILATWYKKNLKEALINQVYADKSTVNGVNLKDPSVKERIYQQYLKAYKKGVFNYIKEDIQGDGQTIPRKYFSGGYTQSSNMLDVSYAMKSQDIGRVSPVGNDVMMRVLLNFNGTLKMQTPPVINAINTLRNTRPVDAAMTAESFKNSAAGRYLMSFGVTPAQEADMYFALFDTPDFSKRKKELDLLSNHEIEEEMLKIQKSDSPSSLIWYPANTIDYHERLAQDFVAAKTWIEVEEYSSLTIEEKQTLKGIIENIYIQLRFLYFTLEKERLFQKQDYEPKSALLKRLLLVVSGHPGISGYGHIIRILHFLSISDFFIERLTGKSQRSNREEVRPEVLVQGMERHPELRESVRHYLKLFEVVRDISASWRAFESTVINDQEFEAVRQEMFYNIKLLKDALETADAAMTNEQKLQRMVSGVNFTYVSKMSAQSILVDIDFVNMSRKLTIAANKEKFENSLEKIEGVKVRDLHTYGGYLITWRKPATTAQVLDCLVEYAGKERVEPFANEFGDEAMSSQVAQANRFKRVSDAVFGYLASLNEISVVTLNRLAREWNTRRGSIQEGDLTYETALTQLRSECLQLETEDLFFSMEKINILIKNPSNRNGRAGTDAEMITKLKRVLKSMIPLGSEGLWVSENHWGSSAELSIVYQKPNRPPFELVAFEFKPAGINISYKDPKQMYYSYRMPGRSNYKFWPTRDFVSKKAWRKVLEYIMGNIATEIDDAAERGNVSSEVQTRVRLKFKETQRDHESQVLKTRKMLIEKALKELKKVDAAMTAEELIVTDENRPGRDYEDSVEEIKDLGALKLFLITYNRAARLRDGLDWPAWTFALGRTKNNRSIEIILGVDHEFLAKEVLENPRFENELLPGVTGFLERLNEPQLHLWVAQETASIVKSVNEKELAREFVRRSKGKWYSFQAGTDHIIEQRKLIQKQLRLTDEQLVYVAQYVKFTPIGGNRYQVSFKDAAMTGYWEILTRMPITDEMLVERTLTLQAIEFLTLPLAFDERDADEARQMIKIFKAVHKQVVDGLTGENRLIAERILYIHLLENIAAHLLHSYSNSGPDYSALDHITSATMSAEHDLLKTLTASDEFKALPVLQQQMRAERDLFKTITASEEGQYEVGHDLVVIQEGDNFRIFLGGLPNWVTEKNQPRVIVTDAAMKVSNSRGEKYLDAMVRVSQEVLPGVEALKGQLETNELSQYAWILDPIRYPSFIEKLDLKDKWADSDQFMTFALSHGGTLDQAAEQNIFPFLNKMKDQENFKRAKADIEALLKAKEDAKTKKASQVLIDFYSEQPQKFWNIFTHILYIPMVNFRISSRMDDLFSKTGEHETTRKSRTDIFRATDTLLIIHKIFQQWAESDMAMVSYEGLNFKVGLSDRLREKLEELKANDIIKSLEDIFENALFQRLEADLQRSFGEYDFQEQTRKAALRGLEIAKVMKSYGNIKVKLVHTLKNDFMGFDLDEAMKTSVPEIAAPAYKGGIDLNSANMAMTVTKDANGGVQVNFDRALIAQIRQKGVFSAVPVIVNVSSMSDAQIRPLLNLPQ